MATNSSFASSSKLLAKKWKQKEYQAHRQKLNTVKPSVDTSPPKAYSHMTVRLKKVQVDMERQAQVDYENQMLLHKMTNIMKNRGSLDNWNDYETKSLNQIQREKEQEKIANENIKIARHLESVQPHYDASKWDDEYQEHEYYKKLYSESTKDYGLNSSGDGRGQNSERTLGSEESCGSENESENSSEDSKGKLPHIDVKERRHQQSGDKKESQVTKLPSIKNKGGDLSMYWGKQWEEHQRELEERNSRKDKQRSKKKRSGKESSNGSNSDTSSTSQSDDYSSDYDTSEDERSHGKKRRKKHEDDSDDENEEQLLADCKQLFRACKQLGVPEDIIIKNLVRRNYRQRMRISSKFKELYELDLSIELKDSLGEDYNEVIDALLSEQEGEDSEAMNNAIHSSSQPGAAVVELICSHDAKSFSAMEEEYHNKYDISLDEDIDSKLDDDCKMLVSLLLKKSKEDDPGEVDEEQAKTDAEELHDALVVEKVQGERHTVLLVSGDGRWTNEDGQFMKLLETQSLDQVGATMAEFKKISGQDATACVAQECSESFAAAFAIFMQVMGNSGPFYAEKLHKNMSHKDKEFLKTLMSSVDMASTRKAYKKTYGKDLTEDIRSKCPSDVGKIVQAMVTRNSQTGGKKANEEGKENRAKKGGAGGKGNKEKNSGRIVSRAPLLKRISGTSRESLSSNQSSGSKKGAGQKEKSAGQKENNGEKKTKKKAEEKNNDEDVEEEVKKIHEALQGWGTDEEPLIEILSSKNNAERQRIKKKYKETYKKELEEELAGELSGDFEELILALMRTPEEYDAHCLHDAMEGLGTNEAALIGIICTRNNQSMSAIKEKYKSEYGKELEDDLRGDTSGDFSDLLLQLARGRRSQATSVDQTLAEEDAAKLHKAGSDMDVSDADFQEILCARSQCQIKATFEEYKKLSGSDLEEGIRKAKVGDAEDAYIALAQALRDPVDFYSTRLHEAMEGSGTNDKMLIRVIVSRLEVDLGEIKARYRESYGSSLEEDIENECSGDYKKLLLALLKNEK